MIYESRAFFLLWRFPAPHIFIRIAITGAPSAYRCAAQPSHSGRAHSRSSAGSRHQPPVLACHCQSAHRKWQRSGTGQRWRRSWQQHAQRSCWRRAQWPSLCLLTAAAEEDEEEAVVHWMATADAPPRPGLGRIPVGSRSRRFAQPADAEVASSSGPSKCDRRYPPVASTATNA